MSAYRAYHLASVELAKHADVAALFDMSEVAGNLYRLAATAGGLAVAAFPSDADRDVLGAMLVSWVALLQKGGEEETARAVARDWLGSLNPDLLPGFAIAQLREMLEPDEKPSTADALAAIVAKHGGVMRRAGDEESEGEPS